jgi:LmbE family N-acetylglucosaminyl deacetylase
MNAPRTHLAQVHAYHTALATGVPIDTDAPPADPMPPVGPDAPTALVFSPHPDDEAVVGALGLRLRREHGWRVVNVAVTLGSLQSRRAARWQEALRSCELLGFDLVSPTGMPGVALERITRADARRDAAGWRQAVEAIAALIAHHQPRLIQAPHALDGHPTHIGTHHLVMDALRALSPTQRPHLTWSEYWNTQMQPGLMVALADADVARLMAAVARHTGEVQRHPYHHSLPAWLIDSARRGAERVAGMGAEAAHGPVYATLYGWQRWEGRRLRRLAPRIVRADEPLAPLFEER